MSDEDYELFQFCYEYIKVTPAEPCVNCRRTIAKHISDFGGEKDQSYNAGYSDGYRRAMLDYGLEDDVEPNIDEAVKCLQVLIDQYNMGSEKAKQDEDIYINEHGNRFYYLSSKDLKAIRVAITILLDVGKAPAELTEKIGKLPITDTAVRLVADVIKKHFEVEE